jgi:hypothetical protein
MQHACKEWWSGSSGTDRQQLEAWLRSRSTPQALATRARIVLGSQNSPLSRCTVWRQRHKHPTADRAISHAGRERRPCDYRNQLLDRAIDSRPNRAGRAVDVFERG